MGPETDDEEPGYGGTPGGEQGAAVETGGGAPAGGQAQGAEEPEDAGYGEIPGGQAQGAAEAEGAGHRGGPGGEPPGDEEPEEAGYGAIPAGQPRGAAPSPAQAAPTPSASPPRASTLARQRASALQFKDHDFSRAPDHVLEWHATTSPSSVEPERPESSTEEGPLAPITWRLLAPRTTLPPGGYVAVQRAAHYQDEQRYAFFQKNRAMARKNATGDWLRDNTVTVMTRYLDAEERERFRVTVQDGLLMQGGRPLHTLSAFGTLGGTRAGVFIFVMTTDGKIYAADALAEMLAGGMREYIDASNAALEQALVEGVWSRRRVYFSTAPLQRAGPDPRDYAPARTETRVVPDAGAACAFAHTSGATSPAFKEELRCLGRVEGGTQARWVDGVPDVDGPDFVQGIEGVPAPGGFCCDPCSRRVRWVTLVRKRTLDRAAVDANARETARRRASVHPLTYLADVLAGGLKEGDLRAPEQASLLTAAEAAAHRREFSTTVAGGKIVLFQHTSFLAGEPVAAAGELLVDQGRLMWLSNKSGHYRPQLMNTLQLLVQLEREGVRSHLERNIYDNTHETTRTPSEVFRRYEAMDWLRPEAAKAELSPDQELTAELRGLPTLPIADSLLAHFVAWLVPDLAPPGHLELVEEELERRRATKALGCEGRPSAARCPSDSRTDDLLFLCGEGWLCPTCLAQRKQELVGQGWRASGEGEPAERDEGANGTAWVEAYNDRVLRLGGAFGFANEENEEGAP